MEQNKTLTILEEVDILFKELEQKKKENEDYTKKYELINEQFLKDFFDPFIKGCKDYKLSIVPSERFSKYGYYEVLLGNKNIETICIEKNTTSYTDETPTKIGAITHLHFLGNHSKNYPKIEDFKKQLKNLLVNEIFKIKKQSLYV